MKHLCKSLFSEGCALRTRLDTSQKNMYVCSYPAIPIVPTLIFFCDSLQKIMEDLLVKLQKVFLKNVFSFLKH